MHTNSAGWKLIIPLFLVIPLHASNEDFSNQTMTLETCIGDNASFNWLYEVPPFFAIEWRFKDHQIAQTATENLSQESLSVNESYKLRFLLLEDHQVGFNITNVTETDAGDYQCIVTLKSTDILDKLKKKLQVKACNTTTRISGPGESTTISTPTPTGDTITIVLGVLIPCVIIALLGVLGFLYWRRKKRKSNEITRDIEASTPMTECVPTLGAQ